MDDDHGHPRDTVIKADGSKEYQDPWIVTEDQVLSTPYSGSVCVHNGATFEVASRGSLSGSLRLQPGSGARIVGQHSGSLHVEMDAVADVLGSQSGSTHVEDGGVVRVHLGGKLAGSVHVAGLIENRGTRGGSEHMHGGTIRDLDGGTVKRPTRRDDGNYYNW